MAHHMRTNFDRITTAPTYDQQHMIDLSHKARVAHKQDVEAYKRHVTAERMRSILNAYKLASTLTLANKGNNMSKLKIDLATTIKFQGGGLYDKKGQLIFAAKLLDQDAWLFMDTSRNIDGIVKSFEDAMPIIDVIMYNYLHNDYEYAGLEYASEFKAMLGSNE